MATKKVQASIINKMKEDKIPVTSSIQTLLDEMNFTTRTLTGTPEQIEHLAMSGVSNRNICQLFSKGVDYITRDPDRLAAFERGRANVSTKIRASLISAALEDRSIQAAIYLDKLLGGDIVQETLNLNITQRPLETADTDDLLNAIEVEVNNVNKDDSDD